MGLTPLMLWLTCLMVVRNQRILTAWDARQHDNARRTAASRRPAPANAAAPASPHSPPDPRNQHQQPRATAPKPVPATTARCPEPCRTVHPIGWTSRKGEVIAPTEEELLHRNSRTKP